MHLGACRMIDPNRVVLVNTLVALNPLLQARAAPRMAGLRAACFPEPEVVVRDSPETGAACGAACMLHRRFPSAENDMLRDAAK